MAGELDRTENPGATRQLVLGFDAGCSTCSDVAKLIEERVDGKLTVRNLRDPEVGRWREKALGAAAPWAPTLFELGPEKDEVRAWVGVKMSLVLGRRLGPRDSWRVMQVLGEIGAVPRIEESTLVGKLPEKARETVSGISRGQFLRGVGGAAVAASLLTGGPLASVAEAATRKPYDIVKSRRMKGKELWSAARNVGTSVDVKNLVGMTLSTPTRVSAAKPVGYMHTLRNGTAQRMIIFNKGQGVTVSHVEFAAPPKSVATSRAFLSRSAGKKTIITKASEGGKLWRVDARRSAQAKSSNGVTALGECPPISNNPPSSSCYRKATVCTDWNWGFNCGFSAMTVPAGCGACYVALAATYASAGLAAAAMSSACSSCVGVVGLTSRQCCAEWCDVWLWSCMGAPPG